MFRIIILLNFLLFGCKSTYDLSSIPNPDNYEIISKCIGDLDGDAEKELVVVYNTEKENVWGKERSLKIYKIKNNKYYLWVNSINALKESEDLGIKNNRVTIRIEDGLLNITNTLTDKWQIEVSNIYKLVDKQFNLIGYNSKYGTECRYWITINYTPLDGLLKFRKDYESCDSIKIQDDSEYEEIFIKRLNLNIMNRTEKQIEFTLPKLSYDWSI